MRQKVQVWRHSHEPGASLPMPLFFPQAGLAPHGHTTSRVPASACQFRFCPFFWASLDSSLRGGRTGSRHRRFSPEVDDRCLPSRGGARGPDPAMGRGHDWQGWDPDGKLGYSIQTQWAADPSLFLRDNSQQNTSLILNRDQERNLAGITYFICDSMWDRAIETSVILNSIWSHEAKSK